MRLRDHCNNCGSDDVTWQLALTVPSGIQANRLNTHDILPVFFLGCNNCSETIQQITESNFMPVLNRVLLGEQQ